jgi:hypothetical protein
MVWLDVSQTLAHDLLNVEEAERSMLRFDLI